MNNKIKMDLEAKLFGETWATEEMTLLQRLKFYRDTGEWPGVYTKETLEMNMRESIAAERADGKRDCVKRKLARAKEAGLNI